MDRKLSLSDPLLSPPPDEYPSDSWCVGNEDDKDDNKQQVKKRDREWLYYNDGGSKICEQTRWLKMKVCTTESYENSQ